MLKQIFLTNLTNRFPSFNKLVISFLLFLPCCSSNGVRLCPVCIVKGITQNVRFTLSGNSVPSSKFANIRFLRFELFFLPFRFRCASGVSRIRFYVPLFVRVFITFRNERSPYICFITIQMPQKWNLSSSLKSIFRETRAKRFLVKEFIVFFAGGDAQ